MALKRSIVFCCFLGCVRALSFSSFLIRSGSAAGSAGAAAAPDEDDAPPAVAA
jgi:hypothetical protein